MNPLGLLALAYPDRVARRRPSESNRFTMSNGVGAQFFDKRDPLANEDFVVVAGVFMHMCTAWVCVFACVCLMGPCTWDSMRVHVRKYSCLCVRALVSPCPFPSVPSRTNAHTSPTSDQGGTKSSTCIYSGAPTSLPIITSWLGEDFLELRNQTFVAPSDGSVRAKTQGTR